MSSNQNQTLYYVSLKEIERISKSVSNSAVRVTLLADMFRLNTLYMITRAHSGHIGSSFSAMDIVTWLWTAEMHKPNEFKEKNSDIFFSSKGHDVPGLYAILAGLKKIKFDTIHKLRRLNGLPGHPDIGTPFIATNTGSLGMGISKARGMVLANRLRGKSGKVFVLTGDGELQEGAFWESLPGAVHSKCAEITVIIDHNKIQSDTWVKDVNNLDNLEEKLKSFGWEVARCDGHDIKAVQNVLTRFKKIKDKPQILIADTIKGKGISFMEKVDTDGLYKFHSGSPSKEQYDAGYKEILTRINAHLTRHKIKFLKLEEVLVEVKPLVPYHFENLVLAYGDELVKLATRKKDIVALDADLVRDTGLIAFKNRFPRRFFECGIAEQDMVSVASGIALRGLTPIVHSFACFLSTRPNEQIYNNATEKSKIIYVGSLAGLLPSGPGHSHQSVRDISTLGSIPNLVMVEPANELEVRLALRYAIEVNKKSTYLRLISIPVDVPYNLPNGYKFQEGIGVAVKKGRDAAIFAYGPVMLSQAFNAARELEKRGLKIEVVNFPWLNRVDEKWLNGMAKRFKIIFTIDDHYTDFGMGMFLAGKLSHLPHRPVIVSLGINEIPVSGTNAEALSYHKLDVASIASTVYARLR